MNVECFDHELFPTGMHWFESTQYYSGIIRLPLDWKPLRSMPCVGQSILNYYSASNCIGPVSLASSRESGSGSQINHRNAKLSCPINHFFTSLVVLQYCDGLTESESSYLGPGAILTYLIWMEPRTGHELALSCIALLQWFLANVSLVLAFGPWGRLSIRSLVQE